MENTFSFPVPKPKPTQQRKPARPYTPPVSPFGPFWPEKTKEERAAAKANKRDAPKGAFVASLASLAAIAGLRLLSPHADSSSHGDSYHSPEPDIGTTAPVERRAQPPIRAMGFERGRAGAPTNEEVASVEQSILPPSYHISLRVVRVGEAPIRMQAAYGIPGTEDGHYDGGRQEIVIDPNFFLTLARAPGDELYNDLLFHENGHAFNWERHPSLNPEQRRIYRETFESHIRDHTPRIHSDYVAAIHNANRRQETEIKAIEYQAELVQAILSLPFPENRTGSWDEAIAQRIHEIHHIPLVNARFEVRLFRWMIELTFPGRSPEAMHEEVQRATRRAVEQSNYRFNTTILTTPVPRDFQNTIRQSFSLSSSETWLRHYAETHPSQQHQRILAPENDPWRQQSDRLAQLRRSAEQTADSPSHMHELFEDTRLLGQHIHDRHVSHSAAETYGRIYQHLTPHDRAIAQRYLPTYGQLIQFKPALFHLSPQLTQQAQVHSSP